MRILVCGDVVGSSGRKAIADHLPRLRRELDMCTAHRCHLVESEALVQDRPKWLPAITTAAVAQPPPRQPWAASPNGRGARPRASWAERLGASRQAMDE